MIETNRVVMENSMSPRIIECQMPLTAISAQSQRGQYVSTGNPSLLHIWWARRPLAACRASIFAALVPQPEDPAEARRLQGFIAQLSDWENSIDNPSAAGGREAHNYIREARLRIRNAFHNRAPRVLDPFAGGGAIPLEALRLGCETYALDLNPVAHVIQLATLVYPQRYANRPGPFGEKAGSTLVGDVRKWAHWVLERVLATVGDLYPKDQDGSTVVAYIWARTVPCPNPACGSAVPLIRQTWLARKPKKYVAYKVEADGPGSDVRFRVMQVRNVKDFGFDPGVGTSRGGTAVCPCCETPLSEKHITGEANRGKMGALPVAVVLDMPGVSGKRYREVSSHDRSIYAEAEQRLSALTSSFDPFSGELSPVPD